MPLFLTYLDQSISPVLALNAVDDARATATSERSVSAGSIAQSYAALHVNYVGCWRT